MKSLGLDLTIRPDTQFATAYDLDGNPVATLRRRHAFDPIDSPAWRVFNLHGEEIAACESGVKARRAIRSYLDAGAPSAVTTGRVAEENREAAESVAVVAGAESFIVRHDIDSDSFLTTEGTQASDGWTRNRDAATLFSSHESALRVANQIGGLVIPAISKAESLAMIADKAAKGLGIVARKPVCSYCGDESNKGIDDCGYISCQAENKPASIVGETCEESGLTIRIETDFTNTAPVINGKPGAVWYDALDDNGAPVATLYCREAFGAVKVMPYDSKDFEAESLESARLMLHNLTVGQREAGAKLDSLPEAGAVDLCNAATLEIVRAYIRACGYFAFDYESGGVAYIAVSAEHGDNAADYYGEYRGGYPWINPKLESLAKRVGAYWEWINPGAIMLCV